MLALQIPRGCVNYRGERRLMLRKLLRPEMGGAQEVGFRPLMHGTAPAAFGGAGGDAQPQIVVCVGLRWPQ